VQERAGTLDVGQMAQDGVEVEKYRGEPSKAVYVKVKEGGENG
jgi:hypothetical protein